LNLVQMILSQFGPSVIGRLASSMGLSSSGVQGALGAAIPAILAALIGRAGQPGGGEAVLDAAQHTDNSILDRLGDIVGGEQQAQVAQQGNSVLSSLLGQDKLGALQGALGSFTGMSSGSSGSLLGMAAPAVMAMLGKQAQSGGLNASGLVDMLMGQKDNVAAAMPKGFADQLEGTGLLQGISDKLGLVGAGATAAGTAAAAGVSRATDGATGAARQAGTAASAQTQRASQAGHSAATQAKASGGGIMRWLLPLIIAAVVLWALWNFFLRPAPVEEAPPPPATTETVPAEPGPAEPAETTQPAETAPAPAETAPAPAEQAATPPASDAAEELTVGDVNLGERFNEVVSSITTRLTDVSSTEEAQAAVSDLQSAQGDIEQMGELAGQLSAEGKTAFQSLVQGALPGIRSAAESALAIEGVGDILRPVVDPMLQSLEQLAQS
jgi:hypothetical protein